MELVAMMFAAWKQKQLVNEFAEGVIKEEVWVDQTPGISLTQRIHTHGNNNLSLRLAGVRRVHEESSYNTDTEEPPILQMTEFRTAGDDMWFEVKNRLAEHGIKINDEEVALAAAGFHAEKALQNLLGYEDQAALREELFSNPFVAAIQNHPEADVALSEVKETMGKFDFSWHIGCQNSSKSTEVINKALRFHPNVVETDVIWPEDLRDK